jgi:dolichol-phosphate mannosyltransferase
MRVAVVLPMYDEADNVAPLLARLADVRAASGLDLLAIAVDDGSRDATRARLVEASQDYAFLRWVAHTSNRGLASTLRTGTAAALEERQPPVDAIACMDADLTHAPEDLPRLAEPLLAGEADFVLGSRYVPGGGMRDVPWARRAISVVGNRLGRQLLGIAVCDMTSGYRIARAAVYRAIRLEEDGFGIQLEGTVKAHRAGFRVAEVPITLGVRRRGYSKMAYTRAFWMGYARLFLRLVLSRKAALAEVSALRG